MRSAMDLSQEILSAERPTCCYIIMAFVYHNLYVLLQNKLGKSMQIKYLLSKNWPLQGDYQQLDCWHHLEPDRRGEESLKNNDTEMIIDEREINVLLW